MLLQQHGDHTRQQRELLCINAAAFDSLSNVSRTHDKVLPLRLTVLAKLQLCYTSVHA
jgi:hypothetical protein